LFLYSVYQPADAGDSAERAVFIRQGFDRMAFVLTPVWAVWRRLWLMLALWALWTASVGVLAWALRLDGAVSTLVYLLGALVFGFEADRAREAALSRRGMLLQGLALGETAGDAERTYFDRLAGARAAPASPAHARDSFSNPEMRP
jgi:hypothetical protein